MKDKYYLVNIIHLAYTSLIYCNLTIKTLLTFLSILYILAQIIKAKDMKARSITIFALILTFAILITTQFSCTKNDELIIVPTYLDVSFPLLTLNYEKYYGLNHDARSIELVFNFILDKETVQENIVLYDKNGSQSSNYDLIVDGNIVFIRFHNDFYLVDGWKYNLSLTQGLKSVDGFTFIEDQIVEFRTSTAHFTLGNNNSKDSLRTLIAVISDIHCGDQRATDGNYSWFGKNADALVSFLELIKTNPKAKELVILGDLFDEWMVPYDLPPFDSSINITNSKEYFISIANSTVNKPIFDKLREISTGGIIDVIYVPGNHDMLITQDVIEEILPNTIWKSDVTGLGKYNPVDKIHMEHGHRYDFFNCPQPLVNEGHILPPGYFVSRLYAAGLSNRQSQNYKEMSGDAEFLTAWTVALGYTMANFSMNPDTINMDSNNIQMTGVDNYFSNQSFNGARDVYAENIEDLWQNTQQINKVPVPQSVFLAIINGAYLYTSAVYEYLLNIFAPDAPKIVVFGHSHKPEIKVFPFVNDYTGIYANSGSWLDADQCKHKVRTFLILSPAEFTDSELDIVSLYQYNLDSDNGGQSNVYKPLLLDEESIDYQ